MLALAAAAPLARAQVKPTAASTNSADSAEFASAAEAADSAKRLKLTANVALANAAGNSNLTTIAAGDELSWKHGAWTLKQDFAFIYGKSDSVETANQLGVGLRVDRSVAKTWALYLGARYDRNPFAGYTSRFGEMVGVVWNAIVAKKDKLDLEAGVGLTQQRATTGVNDDYPNGRLAATYRHSWKVKTYFQQSVEALPDFKDSQNLRVNSLSELVAPISGSIAMRFSYLIQYDRQPEPGFRTTDRLLTAGLQFSF